MTAAFLVTLPWFADASRSGWGEIPTTMFCLAGVVLATSRHFNTWRAVGAGALFGMGFLCKLWFAALFIIPLLIVFLFGSPDGKRLALFVIGSAAVESPWYYWFKMSKAFVLMLPLIAFGIEACIRNLKNQFLLMFLMWGAMILVLSLFQVKSGIYLYPFVPPLVALAAIGAASLFRRTAHVGYLSALFFILTSPLLASLLGEPSPALLPWATVWIVALISILIRSRSTEWPRLATTIMVVLVIAGGVYRTAERLPLRYHDLGYRQIVSALRPRLENFPADRVTYLAPEKPAFAYYMFRNGNYWGTPISPWTVERREQMAGDEEIRAFVIDPTVELYGGWPDSLTLEILQKSTREITSEIEEEAGRKISLRVFVRETE